MSAPPYDEKELSPGDAPIIDPELDIQPLGMSEDEYERAVKRLRWKVRCLVNAELTSDRLAHDASAVLPVDPELPGP